MYNPIKHTEHIKFYCYDMLATHVHIQLYTLTEGMCVNFVFMKLIWSMKSVYVHYVYVSAAKAINITMYPHQMKLFNLIKQVLQFSNLFTLHLSLLL